MRAIDDLFGTNSTTIETTIDSLKKFAAVTTLAAVAAVGVRSYIPVDEYERLEGKHTYQGLTFENKVAYREFIFPERTQSGVVESRLNITLGDLECKLELPGKVWFTPKHLTQENTEILFRNEPADPRHLQECIAAAQAHMYRDPAEEQKYNAPVPSWYEP